MLYFFNLSNGEELRICQLCSKPMCSTFTFDGEYEEQWYHCHDCDMKDCYEETL